MLEQLFSGSAIGAILLGYPYTGIGMVDMLAMALLLYCLLKVLLAVSRRHLENSPAEHAADASLNRDEPPSRQSTDNGSRGLSTVKERAANAWDHLRSTSPPVNDSEAGVASPASVPADFDTEDFLDGARAAYSRLQTAWAARNVDDITPFVTPEMLEAVTREARKDPASRRTEVVVVHATLTSVMRTADEERAVVLFNGLLREEGRTNPLEAREIWHFTRTLHPEGMWRLDAIEAVDNGNDDNAV